MLFPAIIQIRRVLTIMEEPINSMKRANGVQYLHIPTTDVPEEDLLGSGRLQQAMEFLEKAVDKRLPVLVHW